MEIFGVKTKLFLTDSSWIPKVESSIKWYDKVITEYPKSVASKVAYKKKLRTILGWKDIGQYGSKYGIRGNFQNIFHYLSTLNHLKKITQQIVLSKHLDIK